MKKTVTKSVSFCDKCDSEQTYGIGVCLGCGVEHCYKCKKTEGREYSHGVTVTGSGDGYYCNDCDVILLTEGADTRHAAYRRIASLRTEAKDWSVDFERRRKAAEAELAGYASPA